VQFNPVRGAELPPEEIREQAQLPNHDQLNSLIGKLPEPVSTAVWLSAVACVRPEELAFQWKDLDAEKRCCGSCAQSIAAIFTRRSTTARIARFG
jgi:hypothetical protein